MYCSEVYDIDIHCIRDSSLYKLMSISGLRFLVYLVKSLSLSQRDGSYGYTSVRDEMSIRHAAPECFTSGWFSEKSVSWAIGILLFEMHTYGVSPYNQFNKHEHEEIGKHVRMYIYVFLFLNSI